MPTISVNMLCLLTLPRSWRTTRHSQIFWPWNVCGRQWHILGVPNAAMREAESSAELQVMLNIILAYARRCHYTINADKLVIYCRWWNFTFQSYKPKQSRRWSLGECICEVDDSTIRYMQW